MKKLIKKGSIFYFFCLASPIKIFGHSGIQQGYWRTELLKSFLMPASSHCEDYLSPNKAKKKLPASLHSFVCVP